MTWKCRKRLLGVPISWGLYPDITFVNQKWSQDPAWPGQLSSSSLNTSYHVFGLMIIFSVPNSFLSSSKAKHCSYTRPLPKFLFCKTLSDVPLQHPQTAAALRWQHCGHHNLPPTLLRMLVKCPPCFSHTRKCTRAGPTSALSLLVATGYGIVLVTSLHSRNICVSGMGIGLQNPSRRGQRSPLTQENDDAGKDGNQCPRAQASVQDVGLGIAGEQCTVHIAPTHLDGQGVGAAHGRDPTITDHNGQEVQILLLPTEASTPGVHPCCVVCWESRDISSQSRATGITAWIFVHSAWQRWGCSFSSPKSTIRILNLGIYGSHSHLALQNAVSIFLNQLRNWLFFLFGRYKGPHWEAHHTVFCLGVPFIRYHNEVWAWTTYPIWVWEIIKYIRVWEKTTENLFHVCTFLLYDKPLASFSVCV